MPDPRVPGTAGAPEHPPSAPLPSGPPPAELGAQLQKITELLAAARTPPQVFEVVLQPALNALRAVAGAVLLVAPERGQLELAALRGHPEGGRSIWQGGPLAATGPARDALRCREALYFEDAGALLGAYPHLERQTGAAAPVASAVVPMFLDEQPLGALALDFREPHDFSVGERRFLKTLASQCAVALGRARLLETLGEQVRRRTRGLEEAQRTAELLASLGDALQSASTPEQVAGRTLARLGPAVRAQGMLMVDLRGEAPGPMTLGRPTLWGEPPTERPDFLTPPEFTPQTTPLLWQVAQGGEALYLDDDHGVRGAGETFGTLACAVEPIRPPGARLEGFLVAWRPASGPAWSSADRALLARAAATLGLVFERAAAVAALQQRTATLDALNLQLDSRSRALEAFAQLAGELGVQSDPHALVQRAQEVLLSLLPPGHARYWEREDGRWWVRAHSGDPGHLAAPRLDAGLPVGQTPTLDTPWQTREALYQDRAPGPDPTGPAQSVAALPIWRGGQPCGVLNVTTAAPHAWQEVDRIVLTSVARSLGLALERAESMRQLAHSNAELQAANEELEAFAYSVSHDLRAPVRHIKGFSALLRRKLGPDLDLKAGHYLGVIDEAAERMNTLIDAMLGLSRTARQPLTPVGVDLAELVVSVQAELASEVLAGDPEREVRWEVGELPAVYGDRELLRQVMVNLLSNALKYTRTRPSSVIEVWGEERPGEWAVFVRDNGVGFDPRYGGKLFGVFQRLHHQHEFEGTGVGLANVRRIISRHGGTVAAQATADGATFSFTLPRPGAA